MSDKAACPVLSRLRHEVAWLSETADRLDAHPDRAPCRATALRIVADAIREGIEHIAAVEQSRYEWQRKAIESEAAMFNANRSTQDSTDSPT